MACGSRSEVGIECPRQISVAAKHTFTFEWTAANTGREPFGKPCIGYFLLWNWFAYWEKSALGPKSS
jgi:hypothetical protein